MESKEDMPTLMTAEQINVLEKKLKPLIYGAFNLGLTLDDVILLIVEYTDDWAECAVGCFFAGRISTEFDEKAA
jgi:hypothetical protein